jgi:TM2 domain-containing membrane protein YozV
MQETFVTYIGVEKEIGKSKSLAMVLGMLFGWLGIHNFYLQYSYKGFAQAGITLLSIILGAPLLFWLSLISAWVEVILIARGIPNTTPDQLPIK